MTEKQLLEAAARAAGIDGWWCGGDYCYAYDGNPNIPVPWRPLTDDGDALRLAVKLRISVAHWKEDVSALLPPINREFSEAYGAFPDAATRRAIVRAAAACDPHQKGDGNG